MLLVLLHRVMCAFVADEGVHSVCILVAALSSAFSSAVVVYVGPKDYLLEEYLQSVI